MVLRQNFFLLKLELIFIHDTTTTKWHISNFDAFNYQFHRISLKYSRWWPKPNKLQFGTSFRFRSLITSITNQSGSSCLLQIYRLRRLISLPHSNDAQRFPAMLQVVCNLLANHFSNHRRKYNNLKQKPKNTIKGFVKHPTYAQMCRRQSV